MALEFSKEICRAFFMIGELTKQNSEPSAYQPSQVILDITKVVRDDFARGEEILNTPHSELNGYSVIERMNKDQRTFQAFVDESDIDPKESWKWKGTRALARKKAFAMHAHITSRYYVPGVFPQNSGQEDDREMARAMRDIVEWMITNSNYRSSFFLASMGVLVNPVTYLQADYCEVYQKVKEKTEDGYATTEILDEVLSGLSCNVLSADQILITNAYEQDIQKQRAIIKRRYVEYSELQAKYGDHENWGYLEAGVKTIYSDEDGLFYQVKDDAHPFLVEEVTWKNRREDAEICFLNGIYFGNENKDWNPIRHRDNRNAPKYDITPFGYHRVNEHFFYYASMMFEVGWDDRLIDAMYATTMNREFLDIEQPVMVTGVDNFDSEVVFPGGVFSTPNKDAKITPVLPPRATNPYQALQLIEDSMSEASLSETQMGDLPEASQKATAIASADRSARILLKGALASMGIAMQQVGQLLIDIALQHLTTAQWDEITGNLKYREFILNDQIVGGKKVSKKIRFDESLIGKSISEKEKTQYAMKLLEEIGYPDNKQSIYVLNPHLFSKMKYLVHVEIDEMMPKNAEFDRILMERLYQLLRQDPLIDSETLVRELMYTSRPQNAEDFIAKQNPIMQQVMGQKPSVLPALPNGAVAGKVV